MKTAELLTEASLALREKVRDRLIIELDNMALEYRRGIAELSGDDIEDTPVPWAAVTSEIIECFTDMTATSASSETRISQTLCGLNALMKSGIMFSRSLRIPYFL